MTVPRFNGIISASRNVVLEKYSNAYLKVFHPQQSHIRTHLTKNEQVMLYKLARKSRATIGVEIGSFLGASSNMIAAGLRSDTARLYCIDTWHNDAMTEGARDTWDNFSLNTRRYASKIIPVRGFSTEVVDIVARACHGEVGFLFIDGDHSYEGVYADWQNYRPLLKKGGYVAFHDYGWAEGVQRVVKEEVMSCVDEWGHLPNLFWGRMK